MSCLLRVLCRKIWLSYSGKGKGETDYRGPEEFGYQLADNGERVKIWGQGRSFSGNVEALFLERD